MIQNQNKNSVLNLIPSLNLNGMLIINLKLYGSNKPNPYDSSKPKRYSDYKPKTIPYGSNRPDPYDSSKQKRYADYKPKTIWQQ